MAFWHTTCIIRLLLFADCVFPMVMLTHTACMQATPLSSIMVARSSSSHLCMKLASLWLCINIFEMYDCARIGIHPLSCIPSFILSTQYQSRVHHNIVNAATHAIGPRFTDFATTEGVIIAPALMLLSDLTTADVTACCEVGKHWCCRKHAHQVPVYNDGIICVQ